MSQLGIRSFGSDDDDNKDEDVMAMFQDEDAADVEERPTPLAPEDPDPDEEPTPPPPPEEEEQPEQPEQPEEPETPEEAEQRVWANKYRSPEELERAYLEVTTGFTRVAQENAAMRQESQALAAQFEQQQQQVAQMMEYLQAQMAEADPEFAEELQRRIQTQEMVNQQVQPLQEQLQAQQPNYQQQQQVARMQAAANDFYQRHDEIGQGSPEDIAMTQGIVEMMNAGVPIDIGNPEHLDLALEAASNADLAAELMLSPQALQVPGGVARLRQRVGATVAATEASPRDNGTRAKAPVRQRVETFVETGSGGSPTESAPGRTPDEFDEAWTEYQKRSTKGPLFGSRPG